MIPQILSPCQPQHFVPNEDLAIARFIRFLKHIDLKELLSKIPDPRQASKITYSNYSLLMWALSVFFFRQGSKNSLQTTIESMSHYQQDGLLKYLEIEEDSIPHRSVVDDYLDTIKPEEINNILLEIFRWCQKSKLFYSPYAPGPVFGLKRKSPRLNDRKEGNISLNITLFSIIQPRSFGSVQILAAVRKVSYFIIMQNHYFQIIIIIWV